MGIFNKKHDITKLGDDDYYNQYLGSLNGHKKIKEKKDKDVRNKTFITVPENCVLVKQNNFNGKKIVCEQGLNVVVPWEEVVGMISLATSELDTKAQTCMCKEGHEVIIDPCINYSISDPKKYLNNSDNPLALFATKTYDVIRKLAHEYGYGELSKLKVDLNSDDFKWISAEYLEYEYKYGIRFEGMFLKSVELPPSMKDDYEKKQVQQAESERRILEAQNNKEVAEINAEVDKFNANVKNEILGKTIDNLTETLRKNGYTDEQIYQTVSQFLIIGAAKDNTNAHIFINGNQGSVNSMIAGIEAGKNIKNDSSDSNVDDWDYDIIDIDDQKTR